MRLIVSCDEIDCMHNCGDGSCACGVVLSEERGKGVVYTTIDPTQCEHNSEYEKYTD